MKQYHSTYINISWILAKLEEIQAKGYSPLHHWVHSSGRTESNVEYPQTLGQESFMAME